MVRAEKIAKVIVTGGTVLGALNLVKLIVLNVAVILLMLFFISKGLSWYWGAIPIAFTIGLSILQIIEIKRIATALRTTVSSFPMSTSVMQSTPDEKVVDYIAGIMATHFGVLGFGWLGVGKMYFPHNALIITNKRIAFITVPVPGADMLIADTDVGMWQWLLAKRDIEDKLKEMLASQPLEKIFQCHPRNFSIRFEEIKKIKMNSFRQEITFITKDNKRYSYSIRDRSDFEKAGRIFRNFL